MLREGQLVSAKTILTGLLARIRPIIGSLASFCRRVATAVVGDIHWNAPPWASWAGGRARAGLQNVTTKAKRSPLITAAVASGVIVALTGLYLGALWYLHRPKPVTVAFATTEPGVTCYLCEPQGKPNPVLVRFERSVAPLTLAGKDIDPQSELVNLSPSLKGTWHWDNDRTLRFQPAEDWPVGSRFTVTLARKGLVAPQVLLDKYGFDFHSAAFQMRFDGSEFHQDPVDASDKKVVISVTFTHPVDPESFERRISMDLREQTTDTLQQPLGKTPFTVVYDKLHMNAYIHSERLAVRYKLGQLFVRIDPGVHSARGGNTNATALSTSVSVPALYSLAVGQLYPTVVKNERGEPSQVLIVQMNQSVLEHDMPSHVHAWLLPEKNPDAQLQANFEKIRPNQPYRWTESTASPTIVESSQKLTLTQVAGPLEHYELHSFRHEAEPGRYVYIKVDEGLKSFGGYILPQSVERIVEIPNYPREVHIAQSGSLLSLSGEKILTVMTRDVEAIHVQIGRLLPRQLQHVVTQSGGSFSNPSFTTGLFNAEDVTETFVSTIKVPRLKPGVAHYEAIALAKYLTSDATDRRGTFFVRVEAWDTEHDRPIPSYGNGFTPDSSTVDTRLIVLTDLGLLAKKSQDGSQDLFVQSIRTGGPLSDVKIDVLGRNGVSVISATTDSDGHVHFPDLKSFSHEQQPTVYLAQRAGDTSFLPYEERDRRLDLSRFDVGGVDNRIDPAALSAYLFSDRGLYRPGEEIRLGAIVRRQDWSGSLRGVPLRLDITDPRGVNIRSESFTPGEGAFAEIRHTTRETSPAGNYTVAISLVSPGTGPALIGSTTVQVRDFLPDRLRMRTTFSAQVAEGWVTPDGLSAQVSLANLFGTPAANRRVTAHMTLNPAFPAFKAFPDYHFYDPQAAQRGFEENLSPATTTDAGTATFDLNLQRFARATYRVDISTEGFEADGGRGVSSEATQLVSNMPYLVGWRADGALNYVSRDAHRTVRLIAVDPHLQATDVANLHVSRVQARYVSALIRQRNGTFQYASRRRDIAIDDNPLTLGKDGYALALHTTEPGSFAYLITDRDGQLLARIEYQVAGEANLTRTLEKDAQLQMTLSRHDYSPGEEIEMQIQAPYTGSGLITIEREKVFAWRWFKTNTTSSTQKIKLPEGLEGNAYVHVAFVRDPSSEEIYTSPLSYGVQPFSINLDSRRNGIHLEVPEQVKPGETLKIGYSTQRPARLVIFAVDEGILQVAAYKTPDPLGYFFQKRLLSVSTTQILDLILPEFRRSGFDSAAGGDGDSALARHLNPFRRKGEKPIAYWSGVLDADPTRREVEYVVPDYFNGNVRVMAVAVSDDTIGVERAATTVKGDFVLSPNAPTTVTPGDEFDVSVGVANNLAGSGTNAHIQVSLKTGPALQVVGPPTQDLGVAENHEGDAIFRVKTLDRLGAVDLEFTAASAGSTLHRKIDLSVRPATPYMTTLLAGSLRQGTQTVKVTRNLYPQFRTLETGVSLVPLSLAHGLTAYLAHYPYECTEQLVSQAFPALFLSERPEFGYVRAQPGSDLQGLVNELRIRQNEDGAYRLWPGGNYVAEFVSLYAQQFLLEAAARHQRVAPQLIDHGNAWLRVIAARDGNNIEQERDSAYAIYLLTRQGIMMSGEAAALRKRLTDRYRDVWEQDSAAVWLAASLELMKQEREAGGIISRVQFGKSQGDGMYFDPMTRDAFLLFVLSKHFPERLTGLPPDVLESIAAWVNKGYYNSLSAGATLMALDAYVTATHADRAPHLGIEEILQKDGSARTLDVPAELMPKIAFSSEAKALRYRNGNDLNAFYLVNESGFDHATPKEEIRNGFEIVREYTDDSGKPLAKVTLGERVDVHLKFRALDGHEHAQVALVDLLPGGFDLVVPQPSDADSTGPAVRSVTCSICVGYPPPMLQYSDTREDRVVFYTSLNTGIQEIVYRIKATNVGTFVLPPAYGEAMYDRATKARSLAGSIQVVRP